MNVEWEFFVVLAVMIVVIVVIIRGYRKLLRAIESRNEASRSINKSDRSD